MLLSTRWLNGLSGIDASIDEIAAKLTAAGLEVEDRIEFPASTGVVVAEVRSLRPHPKSKKLRLVTVFHGEGEQEVVCGAPNVPEPGGLVLLAKLGAVLPPAKPGDAPFEIGPREVAGVLSAGMLCSVSELALGEGGDGIHVFEGETPEPGTKLEDLIPLGDTVLEIGLTPNRPDCLGHVGLARDLAAMYDQALKTPSVGFAPLFTEGSKGLQGASSFVLEQEAGGKEVALDDPPKTLALSVSDDTRCPRYALSAVYGVTVGPSPLWLSYRLHCLGVRSISNLVDATNLVMLEWGHPIHGFDRDALRGDAIDIRAAKAGETMKTLDDVERTFTNDDLLICDGEGPIAVAGVMGGRDSELSDNTKNVVIECAYFDPRSVRRTSRRLGLHTDASHRFERGVDPNAVPAVLARATALIASLGGGIAAADALDLYPAPITGAKIILEHSEIDALLGVKVPAAVPAAVLKNLGCEVEVVGSRYEVTAPTWRPDLGRSVDLIEEVARIWGYEHILPVVPKVRASQAGTHGRLLFERQLKNSAVAAGLNEAITYAFVSEEALKAAAVPSAEIRVANPLSGERGVMRTSLLPGLAGAAVFALRRQADEVALFELGRTFFAGADGSRLPEERARLAVIIAGRRRASSHELVDVDFFDLKGALNVLVADVGVVGGLEYAAATEAPPFLHPRRSATLSLAGRPVGDAGELHPDVADALGFNGRRAVFATLSVDALFGVHDQAGAPQAPDLPKFPSVSRDLALLLDIERAAGDVATTIKEASTLVESVQLFDVYEGDNLTQEGKRSLAFRIVYRDAESTLTDKKVEKAHQKLVRAVTKTLVAEVR